MLDTQMPLPLPLRRTAIVATFLMAFLGLISDVIALAAFQFRIDWFLDPAMAVAGGSSTAELLYWAAITDLFSYYLPMAPIAVALWASLRAGPSLLIDAATLAAFGFVVIGSVGAVSLATVGPSLVRTYAEAGQDQAAAALAFSQLINLVWGLWQLLDPIFLGPFFLSVGWLTRPRQRRFGNVSIVLGLLMIGAAAATILRLDQLRFAMYGPAVILWFVWATWLGLLLLQREPLGAEAGLNASD